MPLITSRCFVRAGIRRAVCLAACGALAGAATAAAQTPAAPAAQQRGGGRGRGGVQTMTLTTSAWADGGQIPIKYTQPGHDVSPPLSWSDAPPNTLSFVLLVHDLDTTGNGTTDALLQWLVWNIPATARGLPEHMPQGPELPDGTRQISVTGPYYRGPAAPSSGPVHHYLFELYALDSKIDVPPVATTTATGRGGAPPTTRAVTPSETRAAILTAMSGHIRGKAVLVGLFRRPAG